MNQQLTRIKNYFFSQEIIPSDIDVAIQGVKREREARIVKIATFIFATIATTCTVILTEAHPVVWRLASPCILITFIAWTIFIQLSRMSNRYIPQLDFAKKVEFAKSMTSKLFFELPTTSWDCTTSFDKINCLFGVPLFPREFVSRIETIKSNALSGETLFEASRRQGEGLAFTFSCTFSQLGLFGEKRKEEAVSASWSGLREEEMTFAPDFNTIFRK